jgi:hypothetical protein
LPLAAEFCPECGTARSPGLRVRRGEAREALERSDPDPKRVRRTILIAGAALLFGIVIGNQTGGGGGFGPSINIDPTDWNKRPAVTTATEFFDAYQKDEDDADERFKNRGIVVTGAFARINYDDQGNPDLRLGTSGPTQLGADLLPDSYERSRLLKPGQPVTVSCERVRETGDEHWLRNCSIEDTTLALPAPAAAAEKAEVKAGSDAAETPAANDNGNTAAPAE